MAALLFFISSTTTFNDLLAILALRPGNDAIISDFRVEYETNHARLVGVDLNTDYGKRLQQQVQQKKVSLRLAVFQELLNGLSKPKREHVFTQAEDIAHDWQCAICLCTEKNEVVQAPCKNNHNFHKECLTKWFHENETCPVCRQDS